MCYTFISNEVPTVAAWRAVSQQFLLGESYRFEILSGCMDPHDRSRNKMLGRVSHPILPIWTL
jgi:hypothetical protein